MSHEGAAGRQPVALTIAGSDSSGGAGVQADLKAFHVHGVYGTSAITALTAQNTTGVTGVVVVDPAFVAEQIETTVADLPPEAVKTGMLATAAIVERVAAAARRHAWPALVVDPVMVATTGARLLDADAIAALRDLLLPLATLLTPNAPEAAALLERPVRTPASQEAAARTLVDELGAHAALVKGGDLPGAEIVDVLYDGAAVTVFREPRIDTTSTHGSGCALAAAIAAHLAHGRPLEEAVRRARIWVRRAIESAPRLGAGRGPLDLTRPPE